MKQYSTKITMNKTKLMQLSRAQITAMEKAAEALHTEIVQAQVVPRDEGTLQNESFHVDYSSAYKGQTNLVFSTPYARRLYFHPEYNFSTDENPNAQGKWLEEWITGSKKDFAYNAFEEFYRRETGV